MNLRVKLLKLFICIEFKVLLIEFNCLGKLHEYELYIDFVYGLL
jgi:hypothetical protein